MPDKVYASTNNVGTNAKYQGGVLMASDEGLCVALSTLYCSNVVKGLRDILTKPDESRAGAIQVRYEMGKFDYGIPIRLGQMRLTDTQSGNLNVVADYIIANPGTYLMRYPGHAMAAHVTGSSYYFYEPDSALWKYTSASDWKSDIGNQFPGEKASTWTIRKVAAE